MHRISSKDESGKMFVGALSWDTTQENLKDYFSRFGDVLECIIVKNSDTGRSRGFGFVTFADPAVVGLVLLARPHVLDGRTIDPKPCSPKYLHKPKGSNGYRKVFLGGLPPNITESDLKTYFARFGTVANVMIMYDHVNKRPRGFGFLTFEDEAAVERCVAKHYVNLKRKRIEIKKAEPRLSLKTEDSPRRKSPTQVTKESLEFAWSNGPMSGPSGEQKEPKPLANDMVQVSQGWNLAPPPPFSTYGPPPASGTFVNWSVTPNSEGHQLPPLQWASSYGASSQQKTYSAYRPVSGVQPNYDNMWDWNMPQNEPPPQNTPLSSFHGPQYPAGVGPGQFGTNAPQICSYKQALPKQSNKYSHASKHYQDSQNVSAFSSGSAHPPIHELCVSGGNEGHPLGPGPQRGGYYSASKQTTAFHPYKQM